MDSFIGFLLFPTNPLLNEYSPTAVLVSARNFLMSQKNFITKLTTTSTWSFSISRSNLLQRLFSLYQLYRQLDTLLHYQSNAEATGVFLYFPDIRESSMIESFSNRKNYDWLEERLSVFSLKVTILNTFLQKLQEILIITSKSF